MGRHVSCTMGLVARKHRLHVLILSQFTCIRSRKRKIPLGWRASQSQCSDAIFCWHPGYKRNSFRRLSRCAHKLLARGARCAEAIEPTACCMCSGRCATFSSKHDLGATHPSLDLHVVSGIALNVLVGTTLCPGSIWRCWSGSCLEMVGKILRC
eukprot:COSAG01_NODE_31243_length_601_cov_0.816733_1_plen_154_part_00